MVGGGRLQYLLLSGLLVWVVFTFIDLYAADFRSQRAPGVAARNSVERHLLNKNEKDEVTVLATESSNKGFEDWWEKQKQRKSQIKKTCQKYGASVRKNINENDLMYDPRHELLFCRNAKVGTTTWLTHFLRLSALSEDAKNDTMYSSPKLHRNIPPMFRVPNDYDLDLRMLAKSTTSFSMVRHPFERLVSAYQDKMVDGTDPSYFSIKNFIFDKYGEVTFPNFVRMILYKSRTKCRTMSTCRLDKHWKPFISRCAFCDIPYRVIAKAETFLEDQQYIGQLAGVQLERVETHHSSGGSTRDLARKYFEQLDSHTVDKLYALYQVDFEMFGYSPDLFRSYARPLP